MNNNKKKNLPFSKTTMDPKLKSPLETIRRLFSKKVKTETQLSIFPQVLVKLVLPSLPCITTSLTLKRKKLSSLPIQFSLSSSKLKLSKRHSMELFKKNPSAKNLIKNMEEMKFILTGIGTEYAEKLSVFMVKKIRISDKQKRKKSKAVLCLKRNSSENFRILL